MNENTSNRMMLLLIAGIPLTMILAASWLWYFVVNGELDIVGSIGTANRGTLLQPPRQVDDIALSDDTGAPYPYKDLEPRWSMVIVGSDNQCAQQCEHTLYVTRQIHVAMGKEFNRIRRIYMSETALADIDLAVPALSDDHPTPANFKALLEGEHRGTKFLGMGSGGYDALFGEHSAAGDTWYLIDPAGWVMMSYNDEIPYKDVISDMKFLLKNFRKQSY